MTVAIVPKPQQFKVEMERSRFDLFQESPSGDLRVSFDEAHVLVNRVAESLPAEAVADVPEFVEYASLAGLL